ncbi:MAG: ATP phosphoribosyltransferase regulatory subunit [Planctomycetota bacterium]
MAPSPKQAPPRGTRDLYPEDMLRRRYVTQAWRDTAIRHGFEEIDGPTFEMSRLYAVKSGEGILGELFQAYSGKSPEEVEEVQKTGRAPYAMRPEFTPTGSRMFAARAKQLGRPTRWFNIGPRFRAERPQRGRLREFLQFDCDVLANWGHPAARAEAEADTIESCVLAMRALGLKQDSVVVHLNDRKAVEVAITRAGIPEDRANDVLGILDRRSKLPVEAALSAWTEIGLEPAQLTRFDEQLAFVLGDGDNLPVVAELARRELTDAIEIDPQIVRGLAYYTGTVFEVISEGERAVAGGGRYDELIRLLGGTPTNAVGFAMGDVVLSLLLEDKGLLPEGRELMEAVGRPPASVRPDAFVITPDESLDAEVTGLVARLRRGREQADFDGKPWDPARYVIPPLHARASDKGGRNVRKLLKDASRQHARYAVIIETAEKVALKDLDSGEQEEFGVETVAEEIAGRLGR